jgi:hypothetical protein
VPNYTTKYGFGGMTMGQIVLFPVSDSKTVPQVRAAASDFGKRHGKKFKTEVLADSIAVWRVA